MNELNEIVSRLSPAILGMSFDVVEARRKSDKDGVSYWALKVIAQKTPEPLEAGERGASDADNP